MATDIEIEEKTGTVANKHNREMGSGRAASVAYVSDSSDLVITTDLQKSKATSDQSASDMANDFSIKRKKDDAAASASPAVGHELDTFLGNALDERPIWTVLYESIHELFFPVKLPPLELTSKPIPVPDRMAVERSPLSIGISVGFNLIILALVLYYGGQKIVDEIKKTDSSAVDVDVTDLTAPTTKPAAGGGGGGGSNDIVQAIKGKIPKLEEQPIAPPEIPKIEQPALPVAAAIAVQKDIKLPDNPLPNVGVTNSPNVTVASNGTGNSGGMGSGDHGGLGSGSGAGLGPGSGSNYGGGLEKIGGDVSGPKLIFQPEAEFSEEARRAKYQGAVLVTLIVDKDGNPQDVRVARAIGYGLDEKAVEAVKKYKFKPANKVGKGPVAVRINVLVNFHMF